MWKFIRQQVAVSLFDKFVSFWMTNGRLFREISLSPMRSFHQMVIFPENSLQRSLLDLFYPFQVEYLIKEEIETLSRHTTRIVCWSLFTLFKWNAWLKKKLKPILLHTTRIMVEIYYPTKNGSLFSEKFVHPPSWSLSTYQLLFCQMDISPEESRQRILSKIITFASPEWS